MNSGAHTLNDFEYITVIFNGGNVNVKFTNIITDFINSIRFTIEKRKKQKFSEKVVICSDIAIFLHWQNF